jgi:hypothetical protein
MPGDFDLVDAFRHLHDRFDRIEDNVQEVRDLAMTTKTKMEALVGNGHEGAIGKIQNDVAELKEYRSRADATVKTTATFWGLISGALGLVGHFMWDALRSGKH